MADTKISALADVVTLALGDEFAINDVSAAASKKCTATEIQTLLAPPTSDTVAGVIEVAIQSEQETGTDVVRAVTPGRQHFHLSACKCFGFTTGGGTPVLHANSYNMTSITDTATGRLTVTIATDFSSANWIGVLTCGCATNANRMTSTVTKAAGSVILEASSAATTLADPGTGWDWAFFGDL